jgi:hypothetical protein
VLSAFLPDQHETRFFELFQVMADSWLVNFAIQPIHDIIHTQPLATQVSNNLLPSLIGKRFGESNCINTHNG